MLAAILQALTGGLVKQFTDPLLDAYKAKLTAQNDTERLEAEQTARRIEAARDIALADAGRAWSATSIGRWLIVVPWACWWAAICFVSIVNPLFGTNLVIHAMPTQINAMAQILVPAIVIADAGAFVFRRRA